MIENTNNLAVEILNSLQNNIINSVADIEDVISRENIFDPGAVWHGDWRRQNVDEGNFGCKHKPNHFAIILQSKVIRKFKDKSPEVRFATITSRKPEQEKEKETVFLPKHELRFGKNVGGYILPKRKLLIRKTRLENDPSFKFRQNLPEKYVDEAKRII